MTDEIDLNQFQRPGPFPEDPKGSYPTIQDWKPMRFGAGIHLTGKVSNHIRLPDGEITTSALREIACDRSWCRTANTLYKLGEQAAENAAAVEPLPPLPLLLQVLLTEDWVAAAKIAVDGMMDHRPLLDQQAHADFCEIWLNANAMSVSEGQRRAFAVHARIADGAMPHGVVDAWQALAAETSSPGTCRPTATAAAAAYDRWYAWRSEDDTAQALRLSVAGWRCLADDDRRPLSGVEPDPFKLAKALGQEDPGGEEEPAVREGGLLEGLAPVQELRPETLAWFAAAMPTRRKATELVVEISRRTLITGAGAKVIAAFGRRNGFDEPVSPSAASHVRNGLQQAATERRGDSVMAPLLTGLARAWSTLAAEQSTRRTSVSDAARAIAAAAETHARSLVPGAQADAFRRRSAALLAAWAVVSTESEDAPGEPKDDAIAAAHFHAHRLRAAIDGAPDDGEESLPEPTASRVIVLSAVGGTSQTSSGKEAKREFESIAGLPVPLAPVPDLREARTLLVSEFPYAAAAIDFLLSDLSNQRHIHFRPSLLLGSPGGGKTRLIRKLASALSVPVSRFDGSGSSDNAFGGTPRRWSSGEPCAPLAAIRAAGVANPIMHVDEIDKAGSSRHNGSLTQALLPMCEPENSRRFSDPYVQSDVDLSHVSFLLTANDDTVLPAPLRDRLRVIRIPHPGIEHVPAIARGIVDDIMAEKGAESFTVLLNGDELEIAARLWKGGSIRKLRAIIERLLARRDEQAPRH